MAHVRVKVRNAVCFEGVDCYILLEDGLLAVRDLRSVSRLLFLYQLRPGELARFKYTSDAAHSDTEVQVDE